MKAIVYFDKKGDVGLQLKCEGVSDRTLMTLLRQAYPAVLKIDSEECVVPIVRYARSDTAPMEDQMVFDFGKIDRLPNSAGYTMKKSIPVDADALTDCVLEIDQSDEVAYALTIDGEMREGPFVGAVFPGSCLEISIRFAAAEMPAPNPKSPLRFSARLRGRRAEAVGPGSPRGEAWAGYRRVGADV